LWNWRVNVMYTLWIQL